MTIPAYAGTGEIRRTGGASSIQQTPAPGPTTRQARLLADLLGVQLTGNAYRTACAIILRLPPDQWWAMEEIAAEAGITHHQARNYVTELIGAGILARRRGVVDIDGAGPRDLHLYALKAVAR